MEYSRRNFIRAAGVGAVAVTTTVTAAVSAAELAARSDEELRAGMRGSAMRRTKVAGLRRNLAVALGNAGAKTDR